MRTLGAPAGRLGWDATFPPLTPPYTFTDVMHLDLNADDENVAVPVINRPQRHIQGRHLLDSNRAHGACALLQS